MDINRFLEQHQLPESYADTAQQWFVPVAEAIFSHHKRAGAPTFVGINGCQGSGKSTLAGFLSSWLSQQHACRVVILSLDDFYLTKSDRQALAVKVHPLLATRGVPGTHNVDLALSTLAKLQQPGEVPLPRFSKATDNPVPVSDWPVADAPPDIVILEGWCLGVPPQNERALDAPVNDLEAEHDPLGIWRRYVNTQLAGSYQTLFSYVNFWCMLKAPSFDNVFRWRCEQEHKLAKSGVVDSSGIMTDEQIKRFIQHYQRLTEHGFATVPERCHWAFDLDEHRQITQQHKAES
ncbi:kinase [Alteromonas sp. ASW11-19]|uniref:Kinase n=1 Tax=Alteromonas salexigens TaxID=2982530 RepID=A0ABT2VLA7_9ALTE|nr:kinase [Alteromonas salexigens]MCU7554044.1 kinase [Alteromonas salexigens]